jgi:hypothetical protein
MKRVTELFDGDDSELDDETPPLDDNYTDDLTDDNTDDRTTDSTSSYHISRARDKMHKKTKKHDPDYRVDDFYPRAEEIGFVDDQFFDDKFYDYDECVLLTFNETFGIPHANRFKAPDTTKTDPGDAHYQGTVFLFERDYLLEPDGTSAINGTFVSGSCTRTEGGKDGTGAGVCNFVFVNDEGYSVNVNGLLVGPLGSKLAISGGTGGMIGVIGDMDFFPIYEDGRTIGDIFLDPIRYEVMAHLGLTVCP